MRGDHRVRAGLDQAAREECVRTVHVVLRGHRDARGLQVGALTQAHLHAQHAFEVRRRAIQIRLQREPDASRIPLLQREAHLDRAFGVPMILHVEGHGDSGRTRTFHHARRVLHRQIAIDVQPQLRQLRADVRVEPRGVDALDRRQVRRGRVRCGLRIGDVFA